MKKRIVAVLLGATMALGMFGMFGCSSNQGAEGGDQGGDAAAAGEISVYSREDGSGTRGAFIELLGIEQEDASGEKVDMTTPSAAISNSTSVMMTSVADDPAGIGYISLGSLDESLVKAISVDGVAPSVETVKDGSYSVARPFNIATKDGLSPVAQDFITFILSADGQAIVEEEGYITIDDAAAAYEATEGLSGTITVAGSSSVTPVMEKLAEAYEAINTGVTIEVQQSDSTTGMTMAAEGTCDIGMASREVKDSEIEAGLTPTTIAQDGIAIIVNLDNAVSDLTAEQIMKIYTSEITDWSELA